MLKGRDPHKSLKNEMVVKTNISGAALALVKLAWGKEDSAFTLHVAPNSYSTYGIQLPDFLNYLGFSRYPCLFLGGECYCKEVQENFDVNIFGNAFGDAYKQLTQAERHFEKCGFALHQPGGWGFFSGKQSYGRSRTYGRSRSSYHGDGHTSVIPPNLLKETEDDVFRFVFTWIKNSESEKGWTTHYQPKHPPLSVEMRSVFQFLGINAFKECPQFDFEPCSWRHIEYVDDGHGPLNRGTDRAHQYFDAHKEDFSPGMRSLLSAQEIMEKVGMGFLPSFDPPESRRTEEINRRVREIAAPKGIDAKLSKSFDVAVSFAGTERKFAEKLALTIKKGGFTVFYDEFYPEELWGKDLVEFFHEIYSKRSRYCVIFVSNEYLNREWTVHERRSAQERMLKEKGSEYILPIKVEDVELPGIPSTIGYMPISTGIQKIAEALIKKLKKE